MKKDYKYDAAFCAALDFVFDVEGGYSNHKNDRGGATNFGITQKTYDSYRLKKKLEKQTVKNITQEEATQIYYEDYWLKSGAAALDDFAMAIVVFDTAVNHGVTCAKVMFDESNADIRSFLNLRRVKYRSIVNNRPSQKVFYKGWMNRVSRLENYIEPINLSKKLQKI